VIEALVEELQTIFPNNTIPRPIAIKRTQWHRDEFARGSYAAPPVNMDPLTASYIAEPLNDRVFFAGEATSTDRFGYVDGAFDTGRREAERIEKLCLDEAPSYKVMAAPIGMRPENDKQLREAWFEVVKEYVL